MPDLPSWIHRVPEILAEIEQLPAGFSYLDRATVERIFALSPRQSNRLMRACPEAIAIGRSILVSRESLHAYVAQHRQSGAAERELVRRQKLHEILGVARSQAARRSVPIPVHQDAWTRQFADLPEGIHLAPGRLSIQFTNPTELLQRLFDLAQAISNDPQGFEVRTGSTQLLESSNA